MGAWKDAAKNPKFWVGIVLFVVGSYVLWSCFGGQGKNTPWPLGVATPF